MNTTNTQHEQNEITIAEAVWRLADIGVFFILMAILAIACSCSPSAPHGATVKHASSGVKVVHYAAGDVAFLPPEAP